MEYKVMYAEIKDGVAELPEGAIPMGIGLMLTGPLSGVGSADTKMRDCVKYLMPLRNLSSPPVATTKEELIH